MSPRFRRFALASALVGVLLASLALAVLVYLDRTEPVPPVIMSDPPTPR